MRIGKSPEGVKEKSFFAPAGALWISYLVRGLAKKTLAPGYFLPPLRGYSFCPGMTKSQTSTARGGAGLNNL